MHIKRVFKVIALEFKGSFAVITQRRFILLVIFLIGVIRQMGFFTQLADLLPVAFLVCPVVVTGHRFISPVKRDDGRTAGSGDPVVFPGMGIKILPVKPFSQSCKNALLLILVRLTHVVYAVDQDHDPRHRARHAHVARLGGFSQTFVYRNIAFRDHPWGIWFCLRLRHSINSIL